MVSVYLNEKELQVIHDALNFLQNTEYCWTDDEGNERNDEEIDNTRKHYEKLQAKIYLKKRKLERRSSLPEGGL